MVELVCNHCGEKKTFRSVIDSGYAGWSTFSGEITNSLGVLRARLSACGKPLCKEKSAEKIAELMRR